MNNDSGAARLVRELAKHEAVAYIPGDDPKRDGTIRDGGYRCACGAVFGVREYVPAGRRGREPHPVAPTKEDHLAEVAQKWFA